MNVNIMGRKSKQELEDYLIKKRRKEVTDMWFSGSTVKEMAEHFHVDERTIYRDCEYIENHADELMKSYIVKTIPFLISRSIQQINMANQIVSRIAQSTSSDRDKITAALATAKTARDVVEIIAGNKSVVDMALELDESLKGGESLDVLLPRDSTEEQEPEQDSNRVF
jgi:hypothetical protein